MAGEQRDVTVRVNVVPGDTSGIDRVTQQAQAATAAVTQQGQQALQAAGASRALAVAAPAPTAAGASAGPRALSAGQVVSGISGFVSGGPAALGQVFAGLGGSMGLAAGSAV